MSTINTVLVFASAGLNLIFLLCLAYMRDSRDEAREIARDANDDYIRSQDRVKKLIEEKEKLEAELKDANEHLDHHHKNMTDEALKSLAGDMPPFLKKLLGIEEKKPSTKRVASKKRTPARKA